jgi:hypothetical protein
VLAQVRLFGALKEKKLGTFYLRGSAFLHFHEDPAGLFADVKPDGKTFTRFAANSKTEQRALLTAISGFFD